MDAAPLSMLDQYRETFFHDALFAPDDVSAVGAGVHRSSRMKVVAGSGYMEQLLFKNGLLAGRGDYRLERAHDGVFGGMETCFGVSLMVAGTYALAIPELRFQKQMLVDQAWIRAGHVEAVHCTQPADQVLRGISIDVTAGLLEAWRDEAPKALNSGVRAVLQHSGPVLRPLPGVGRELRGLALRMLQLDSSSLCGRLELESLALDFLVRVLRAGEGGQAGLTRAERRERRLRVALEEARDILDAEWAAPPTIAELGRRVGLNECYLKAGFREYFGGTIGAYARERRLERARDLIEREGHGVQEAALAVGFSNLGWFSATFRAHFGCLPSHLARGGGR